MPNYLFCYIFINSIVSSAERGFLKVYALRQLNVYGKANNQTSLSEGHEGNGKPRNPLPF